MTKYNFPFLKVREIEIEACLEVNEIDITAVLSQASFA